MYGLYSLAIWLVLHVCMACLTCILIDSISCMACLTCILIDITSCMACLSVCVYGLSLACVYGLSFSMCVWLVLSMCVWLVFQYVYGLSFSMCVWLVLALPSSMALEGNSSVSIKYKVKIHVLVEHATICPAMYRYACFSWICWF